LDGDGALRHRGGALEQPGMYAIGLRFVRRRKSGFIDGVWPDAVKLSRLLAANLDRRRGRVAAGASA
jgi:putative flavoprotein involved in K+ transport